MPSTLIHNDSPMQRLSRLRGLEGKQQASRLPREEQEEVRRILAEPMDYIHDERFEEPDAYEKLFEQAPELPEPNTSWYQPVMEEVDVERAGKQVVNVVLTAEQERVLFLQYNYARYRVSLLREQMTEQMPSDEQARELLHWYRLAMRLRERIAGCNLALVLAMAKRVKHSDLDFSELISEGNMALLRAIDKFNAGKGYKFSTYACHAIIKAFGRAGQKQTRYRERFPTEFDPALERSNHHERKAADHEQNCADEVARIVADNDAELTEVERAVIEHRFALGRRDEDAKPLTLEQVGQLIGRTKERVRQIEKHALGKIRRTLESAYLDGRAEEEAEAEAGEAEANRG